MINRLNQRVLVSLILSLCLGTYLWLYSDSPPYGSTNNELSNNYWGLITDIAHKWRSGDFHWWDLTVTGGTSLFSSGQYPILNPTNVAALFLNDDQFYLLKLIEPFVIGFFCTCLLMVDVFEFSWVLACFGALFYVGLPLASKTTMAESSIFLWGCFLFPAMLYAYLKIVNRDVCLAAALVGAILALQFSGSGVIELPQVLLWWLLFLFIHLLFFSEDSFIFRLKNLGKAYLWLILFTVGVWAIQLVPTIFFFSQESARLPGHYPIINFPLVGDNTEEQSLGMLLNACLRLNNLPSIVGFMIGFISMIMVLVLIYKSKILNNLVHRKILSCLWLATGIYFVTPTLAGYLSSWFPFLKSLFKPLTQFTFRYALHILDFCVALTFTMLLSRSMLSSKSEEKPSERKIKMVLHVIDVCSLILVIVLCVIASPFLMAFRWDFGLFKILSNSFQCLFPILLPCAMGRIVVLNAFYSHQWTKVFWWILLVMLSFYLTFICYVWNDKGRQTHVSDFNFDSPEYQYYKSAQGKYFIPYSDCPAMSDDYSLLGGVYGTESFLPLMPYRFMKFLANYHSNSYKTSAYWPDVHSRFTLPSPSISSRFPVEFTAIKHGEVLPWSGFIKFVDGRRCDIWVRQEPTEQIRFAYNISIDSFDNITKAYDTDFSDTVMVEEKDAEIFSIVPKVSLSLPKEKARANIIHMNQGHIEFDVHTPKDVVVIVPQMYQKGWKLLVNGRPQPIFPADYLFLGFQLPPGEYHVEMKFMPPGIWLGILFTLGCIGLLGVLIKRYQRMRR